MKEGFKAAAVFVGTVIGAGFATGREVALFFSNCCPAAGATAGFFIGFLCYFFMRLGGKTNGGNLNDFLLKKRTHYLDLPMFICSYITFTAMFSGAETLIMSIFNISHIGILSVLAAALITVSGLKSMKLLNAIAVPLIIVFIFVIFIKNGEFSKVGNYNPTSIFAYGAMNIMPAGAVMARLGKDASKKTAATAGVMSGLMLATMLTMIILITKNRFGEMPVFDAASIVGLKYVSGAVIYLSVFTTMVSALETASDVFLKIVPDKRLSTLTVCLMAYPFVLIFTFAEIVDYFYPVVSAAGVIILLLALFRTLSDKRRGAKAFAL